jgi:hypothetical protein
MYSQAILHHFDSTNTLSQLRALDRSVLDPSLPWMRKESEPVNHIVFANADGSLIGGRRAAWSSTTLNNNRRSALHTQPDQKRLPARTTATAPCTSST